MEKNELLIASAEQTTLEVEEVSEKRRVISGIALVFEVNGNTSVGPTRFAQGSIRLPDDIGRVKLLLDHDATIPLGYMSAARIEDNKLLVELTVAEGDQGDLMLQQAKDRRRDGFSVGTSIEEWEMDGDVAVILSSTLNEVSMVSIPAFSDARITEVRASGSLSALTELPMKESSMTENTENVENVETVTAAAAPIYITPGKGLGALTASLTNALQHGGNLQAALADVIPSQFGNTTGATIPQAVDELWNASTYTRPLVDAIGVRPLTSMSISGFRKVVGPTVGRYAGNKTAVPSNTVSRESVSFQAQRFAGGWDIDRALIDFGGEGFIRSYLNDAVGDYREQTEAYLIERLLADATEDVAADDLVSTLALLGQAAARNGSVLDFVQLSPDFWGDFSSMTSAEAPWFLQSNGGISLATTSGSAGGVTFGVNAALPEGTVLGGDKRAVLVAEKNPPVEVQALDIPRGGVDLGVFGYFAAGVVDPKSVFVLTKAA